MPAIVMLIAGCPSNTSFDVFAFVFVKIEIQEKQLTSRYTHHESNRYIISKYIAISILLAGVLTLNVPAVDLRGLNISARYHKREISLVDK